MDNEQPVSVYCPACSKLIVLSDDLIPGDSGSCPFCFQKFRLEEITVLVASKAEED